MPLRHQTRVNRKLVLKTFRATKVLLIGILNPAADNLFVTKIKSVFQVMQTNQPVRPGLDRQTRRLRRMSLTRAVECAESIVQTRPIDAVSKTIQRMIDVYNLFQGD